MAVSMYAHIAIALLGIHIIYVWTVRFARLRELEARFLPKYALSVQEEQRTGRPRMQNAGLQGVRDAQTIMHLGALYDAPFLGRKALEFALFRTYAIPSISALLWRTGQLAKLENSTASRRYVDTSLLIDSFVKYTVPPGPLASTNPEDGPQPHIDDPRGAIAIARMNYIHSRYGSSISNDDLLYTLSVFVLEPAKWYARYEWRALSPLEKEANYVFYAHVGRCMGIQYIPESLQELVGWSEEYERTHMVYAQSNADVARATVALLMHHVPRAVQPFAEKIIIALMEDRLRKAMGYPAQPRWIHMLVDSLLGLRALTVRTLFLPRVHPISMVPLSSAVAPQPTASQISREPVAEAVCPASGAKASEGRMCPVGGHMSAAGQTEARKVPTAVLEPRLEPLWWENDPHYSRPAKPWGPRWVYEILSIRFGWLDEKERHGAPVWSSGALHANVAGGHRAKSTVGGYRLEELGPRGMEMQGRDKVRAEAERLLGHPLSGPWAFDTDMPPGSAAAGAATGCPVAFAVAA